MDLGFYLQKIRYKVLAVGLQEWEGRGKALGYKGHKIFYLEEGKGETLLLIHGFPTASWDWHKIWWGLSESYRVIALDMIGFGFSDKPAVYPYSIMDQADLHEHLLDFLNVKQVHVLAHDYGDTVAQELLARYNSDQLKFRINGVCMLNGGLFHGIHKPRLIQKLLISPIGFLLSPLLNKNKLRKTFSNIFGEDTQATPKEIDEFYELITCNKGKAIIYKTIRYMKERVVHQKRWASALRDSKVPLRLIDGATDPISGKHMADWYSHAVPNPDVILLENIGHYPQIEAPEEVLHFYMQFLQNNRVGRRQQLAG